MKNFAVSLTIVGFFAMPALAQPQQPYPWITNPANGHSYRLLPNADWRTSEHWAESLGGHLATIADQEEQEWVFNTFGKGDEQRLLWLGLKKSRKDGKFSWIDGTELDYTNWFPGEPNDVDDSECFGAMYYADFNTPGSWNDWSDRETDPINIPFQGVVERDESPGYGRR